MIQYFGQTDAGRRRPKNEDTFFIHETGYCALVADGIGGAAAGEIASELFARTARQIFPGNGVANQQEAGAVIQTIFQQANERIFEMASRNPAYKGMGCTAELIVFHSAGFSLGHMGDSRSFRLRNGRFKQLTTDHSLVQEQLNQGLITPEEALQHTYKNVILRAVGIKKNPSLDLLTGRTYPGDLFLLCSDGLTDMVNAETIHSLLLSAPSLEKKVQGLIQAANAAGGKDNITVVLAEHHKGPGNR